MIKPDNLKPWVSIAVAFLALALYHATGLDQEHAPPSTALTAST